ncbi:MAG: S8 family serine peptidase [bacterium]
MKSNKTFTKIIISIIFGFSIISLLGSNNFSSKFKLSKSVMTELNVRSNDEKILVWIELTDKGNNVNSILSHPELFLTQKAIERRMKVKPLNALVDYTDIPVNSEYLNKLQNSGIEIKNKSKWFNRFSCYTNKVQIEQLINNDFVSRVDLVKTFKKNPNDLELKKNYESLQQDNNGNQNTSIHQLNYGESLEQMELINAPTAHDSGYKGQGVLIASLDAGFDNLQHPSFDSIRAHGLRTYDFVNGDTNVANESGQMGEGSHGTMTLSLVGGFRPGDLISPAFRSQYILAKTENTDSETPLEEDNWIAAAEWADSLGADIITSSLGYIGMDEGSSRSYDWTWMNGDSCIVTIGADLAVNKGIIVCNSAGNEGFNPTHNTLGAPSDGDSVIAVGSCNSNKNRSGFSSVGLSVDGRIKPDIVALGSGNIVASPGAGSTGYTSGSGTSFSCPMTAGVCAVILSANHNLTPMQVRQVLTQTADSSFAPNRRRGWGLINCWEALKLGRNMTSINNNHQSLVITGYSLGQNIPNPFNPSTVISYTLKENSNIIFKVFNILGKEVATLVNERQPAGNYSINFSGNNLSSGTYFYALIADGNFVGAKRMLLLK